MQHYDESVQNMNAFPGHLLAQSIAVTIKMLTDLTKPKASIKLAENLSAVGSTFGSFASRL